MVYILLQNWSRWVPWRSDCRPRGPAASGGGGGGYFSGVYCPRASSSCTRRTSVYTLIDNHNQIWGLGVKTIGSLGPLLCPRWFLGLFGSVGGSRRALRLSFRTAFGSGCLLLTSRRQSGKTQDCMSNIKTHKCTTQSELRQSYLPFLYFLFCGEKNCET